MTTAARALLASAGIATAVTGTAHLALPTLYDWRLYLGDLVDSIRWALLAINAFFSVLLLLAGFWTIRAARAATPDRALIAGLAVFWLFNFVYQLILPFPHPTISIIARAFAFGVFACYAVALYSTRRAAGRVHA
jgi:hypothetical protein